MTNTMDWQTRVGAVWAEEWRRTDRSFADLSPTLNAAIRDAAGDAATALDIGCGAGGTSLALAEARPDIAITGIDLSPALVAIAAERVPTASFRVADAASDPLGVAPDLLYSRHGVMFFDDPVAAFTALRRQSAPDARLVFSCFRAAEVNAFAHDLPAEVLGAPPPAATGYAPGPFGFADRNHVAAILAAAGWQDARVEQVDFGYIAGEGTDPVADAASFLGRIGPCARGLATAPAAERPHLTARLNDALARYRIDTRVVLPASAWLWRAQAGGRA